MATAAAAATGSGDGNAAAAAGAVVAFSPSADGLQVGQLVEIFGEPGEEDIDTDKAVVGECGQLVDVGVGALAADDEQGATASRPGRRRLGVLLVESGLLVRVDPKFVRPATVGYGDSPYDVVIGPRTDRAALGRTVAECLADKGHCVIKAIATTEDTAAAYESILQADASGALGRLAQEVEEGYLGRGGRAKATWLDPDSPGTFPYEGLVWRSDAQLSSLAELLASAGAEETVGRAIAERTPALVCMSLTDAEEQEYESAVASDGMIQEYYATWARSVARALHFLGPASGTATLSRKRACPLQHFEESYEVIAAANTILIFREDAFDYSFEEAQGGGRTCWLSSSFLRPAPQWDFGDLEGDMSIFETPCTGPPPPKQDLCAVAAISIQACGKMTDHHKEWAAYMAGCDGQLEMPILRFDYLPYYSDETDMPMGTTFVKHFSVQDGIELFDNRLFEISNMEAEAMDPMCRQVLEVGYLSIHQLGYTKKWSNTHPVHASVSVGTDKQEWVNMPGVPRSVATNNQLAIMANRFNYVFNLKGGSYVMDTACSSSLCASHLGKVNLLEQRWDPLEYHLGLGSGLTLTVFSFIHSCASHMLSPGGRCFTFNATANGYNRGDGTAAMLLKAGAHDDVRMCYLRGTQVGQDGRSASMSAPNGPAQEKCVWGALREARMDPPESTVWECHGTGTSLGDPIEVGAVRKVQIKMKRTEPLMIASSKANFGHLEGSAAAIAMNKCVMVVMKICCAATQHLKTLNPHLDHAAFDAIFTSEANPYLYNSGHCQVSSFGVGGTNGHAIFWGEGFKPQVDHRKYLMKKLMTASAPIVADGPDPADWEYSGPPFDLKPGEKCRIVYSKDPITGDEEIRFDTQIERRHVAEFYSTTGSHNDWSDDRMLDGEMPGVFFQEVEIPPSGTLEFRLLADGDQDKSVGPEETTESRVAPIVGPSKDVRNSWLIKGMPGSLVRIEFVESSATGEEAEGLGWRSITWFPVKEDY